MTPSPVQAGRPPPPSHVPQPFCPCIQAQAVLRAHHASLLEIEQGLGAWAMEDYQWYRKHLTTPHLLVVALQRVDWRVLEHPRDAAQALPRAWAAHKRRMGAIDAVLEHWDADADAAALPDMTPDVRTELLVLKTFLVDCKIGLKRMWTEAVRMEEGWGRAPPTPEAASTASAPASDPSDDWLLPDDPDTAQEEAKAEEAPDWQTGMLAALQRLEELRRRLRAEAVPDETGPGELTVEQASELHKLRLFNLRNLDVGAYDLYGVYGGPQLQLPPPQPESEGYPPLASTPPVDDSASVAAESIATEPESPESPEDGASSDGGVSQGPPPARQAEGPITVRLTASSLIAGRRLMPMSKTPVHSARAGRSLLAKSVSLWQPGPPRSRDWSRRESPELDPMRLNDTLNLVKGLWNPAAFPHVPMEPRGVLQWLADNPEVGFGVIRERTSPRSNKKKKPVLGSAQSSPRSGMLSPKDDEVQSAAPGSPLHHLPPCTTPFQPSKHLIQPLER